MTMVTKILIETTNNAFKHEESAITLQIPDISTRQVSIYWVFGVLSDGASSSSVATTNDLW